MKFNIITASHNEVILNNNLAASELFKNNKMRNMIMRGYVNVPEAYEAASKICFANEYNLFVHHDVFLPPTFEDSLKKAIVEINTIDEDWGVLGLYGATMENGQRKFYGHVRDRGHDIGAANNLPHEVQTLDELLLITKGDFVFDEQFDLHFYGADICMQAHAQGRKNYAIAAHCHHNSSLKHGYISQSFKDCKEKFKNKWTKYLPINTPCVLVQ